MAREVEYNDSTCRPVFYVNLINSIGEIVSYRSFVYNEKDSFSSDSDEATCE